MANSDRFREPAAGMARDVWTNALLHSPRSG